MLTPIQSACVLISGLPVLTLFAIAAEAKCLGYLYGRNLARLSYVRFIFSRCLHHICTAPQTPATSVGLTYRVIIIMRLAVSILPWFFIPFFQHHTILSSRHAVIYIVILFELQFVFECFASWLSGSKFALFAINRRIVSHFTSQVLWIMTLLSMAVCFSSFDWSTQQIRSPSVATSFPFLVLCFIACLCKDEIGPLGFTTKRYELLEGSTMEYSRRVWTLTYILRRLDILFSCAFLVTLFCDFPLVLKAPEEFGHVETILFLLKMVPFFLLFIWVDASLLVHRSDQWLHLFQVIFLPIALIALLISICIKCLW